MLVRSGLDPPSSCPALVSGVPAAAFSAHRAHHLVRDLAAGCDLPLLILVTILAVLHQFGLNRLIRLSETRFSPLWAGPSLSVLFYLSSVGGGACGAAACFLEEPAGFR